MSSARNDQEPRKTEVQSRLWRTGVMACVAAVCAPLAANAGIEPATGLVEETGWRTVDADPAIPAAVAIEIVAPIDDDVLGAIIFRQEHGGLTHTLRFGGPR